MNRVKFGDVVREVKINVDRSTDDHEYFIAGEHMDSCNIHITRRGRFSESDVGPAFIRLFRPGQVLYGSRRTYLRKVAVADFEGITSNTTFVLETKDSNRLLQELLPYIMLTDRFSEYAINNSQGSTNPYILFKDLAAYEFDLPTIEEQRQLVVLLSACDRAKEAYKRLLKQTDEVVKSQFIEMFESGDKSFTECSIIETCVGKDDIKCGPFGTQLKQSEYTEAGVAVWGIPEINAEFKKAPVIFVSQEKANQLEPFSLIPGDIAMSRKGNVGQCAIYPDDFEPGIIASDVLRIRIDRSRLVPKFMQYQLHHSESVKHQISLVSNGAVMAGINVTKLKSIKVYVPPMDLQIQFVTIADQSDKSKFVDLVTTISELYTCMIKSLSIYGGQYYAE